jgi:hypothetical protein
MERIILFKVQNDESPLTSSLLVCGKTKQSIGSQKFMDGKLI